MSTYTLSWKEFKSYVSDVAEEDRQYIYRGQANSLWTLTSTWHRALRSSDLGSYWELLEYVHDHIATASGRAWDLSDSHDTGAFLGFLQHHGFPTPLLDWSRSPYIAAYFAFSGVNTVAPDSDHVTVFLLNHLTYQSEWQQSFDPHAPYQHVSVVEISAKGNQKQIIQQGLYTFANVPDQRQHIRELEAIHLPDGSVRGSVPYLLEFLLPVKEAPVALRELRLMGISAMSLFPGVEGLCRGLRESLFCATEIGQTPSERQADVMSRLMRLRRPGEGQHMLNLDTEHLPGRVPPTWSAEG